MVGNNIPTDSEGLCRLHQYQDKPTQSSGGANRCMVYVYVFIGMSVCYEGRIYIVFIKKM